MNRHHRRAYAAADRAPPDRAATIRTALAYLAAAAGADPTISGCTVMTPDGEVLHLDAATARAMAGDAPTAGRG